MIKLRPYQETMIASTMGAIPSDQFILVQAATAAGKTIYFSLFIKQLLSQWPHLRIAVLAHRRELIIQAWDKLKSVWPEAPIGIACASVQSDKQTDLPITIGSIQTLINQSETTKHFDIIIIDEVHRMAPRSTDSQYKKFLDTMMVLNSNVRILGLTATPFRLGHGYIYGKGCKPDAENWFEKCLYKIGIKDLQNQGYLCGCRAKAIVDISADLQAVKTSGGDYNLGSLSSVMSRDIHLGSAIKAYHDYGEDRCHVVIFAVSIEHAEKLKHIFQKAGHKSGVIHHKIPLKQRDMILKMFESGELNFIVNVGVLTEGWDSTAVDCILMCRPTKSPSLYVQMTGRGLRLHPGKKDVLILDLANNCMEHGDPDKPLVKIPGRTSVANDENKPASKICPNCREAVHPAVKKCPECGYEWRENQIDQPVQMKEVIFSRKSPEPFDFKIHEYSVEDYTSKKGNRMLRLSMETNGLLKKSFVNHFFMFDQDAHAYARERSRMNWYKLCESHPPESTEEALERQFELEANIPNCIQVIADGKWLKVHSWRAAS